MLRKFQKTLSVGLSGLLVFGIGIGAANASDAPKRAPNVLHEMVPHVILPETIQYNKTAKNVPGTNYGVNSPYVATYVAFPSYQAPPATAFRQVGQSVYPVSPPLLPAPLPQELPAPDVDVATEEIVWQGVDGEDIVLSQKMTEPIRLASGSEGVPPPLPIPSNVIMQTRGLFCQQPAKPPSAWAFSSPIFKVASVPAGWGGQAGGIVHSSPRGSVQHAGFQPVGSIDPAMGGTVPQGIPYTTMQAGHMGHNDGPQVQVLPNGMILLTMPPTHHNCGLLRCRSGCAPRTILLPPAGFVPPQAQSQGMMPQMMPQEMMAPAQMAMMQGGFGTPFMQVSQQPLMMSQMMPQVQTVPVTAMTPMGPAIVGYQQVPMVNPTMSPMMNPMMNQMAMMNPQMMNSQMHQLQQMQHMPQLQMAVAMPDPIVASQALEATAETGDDTQQPAMAVVATPLGYAIQVPVDALQAGAATQFAQLHQELMQSQMPMQSPMQLPMQIQMPMNPYAGLYATPFGYVAMNQSAGQFGMGQPMMMHVGHSPMGMGMGMPMQGGMSQGGMSVSDMLQILTFINSNKPQQRRGRMAERVAERRENRRTAAEHNDPFTQLMQAWTTPYVAPDTTLRMPARNAYPYGHFGVQASPVGTANYGGFHNLYFGNTNYPGLY